MNDCTCGLGGSGEGILWDVLCVLKVYPLKYVSGMRLSSSCENLTLGQKD